jgi:Rhodopirellula transposase DDE domain
LRLFPDLDAAFLEVIHPFTAGDPMREGVLWTNLSLRQIAAELDQHGFCVSVPVVAQLLKKHQMGRRKALKKRSFKQHPDSDRQFQKIARLRAEYEAAGNPVFSIDTKKKELIGNLFREGYTYSQEITHTLDHDFPAYAEGVIHPHALYDVRRNHGHINLGISNDTSEFACDSIAYAWEHYGRVHYPQAGSALLLCDGGGSNASNRYVFKHALEKLANRIGLEIRIAHYPPYKSKFNPIEHRLFPHVTRACKGAIFLTVDIAMEKIAKTTTSQGLTTTVHLLKGDYPNGQKAPEGYKESMKILFDDELPHWNYRAVPTKQGS